MSIVFTCPCGRSYKVPAGAAGKKVQCMTCGRQLRIPQPAGAEAAPAQAARRPARPAAPRPAQASPANTAAAAVAAAAADVPVARLAEPPDRRPLSREALRIHHGAPKRHLGGAQITLILSSIVMLAFTVDVLIFLARNMEAGTRSVGLFHALWLVALVISFFVAAAGAKGSRVCIGILIGGAIHALFSGPALMIMAKYDYVEGWAVPIAGASLALGAIYLVLLLATATRRHLAGHGGAVAGGAVFGFLFGGVVAATGVPGFYMLWTRSPVRDKVLAAAGLRDLIDHKNNRVLCQNSLVAISRAMTAFTTEHRDYFPEKLDELIGEDCKAEDLKLPDGGSFVYLFGRHHLRDLPSAQEADELKQFIIVYCDPKHLGDKAALVLRPPVPGGGYELVEYMENLERFKQDLDFTRDWLKRNPPNRPSYKDDPNKIKYTPYTDE